MKKLLFSILCLSFSQSSFAAGGTVTGKIIGEDRHFPGQVAVSCNTGYESQKLYWTSVKSDGSFAATCDFDDDLRHVLYRSSENATVYAIWKGSLSCRGGCDVGSLNK